jgi:hypothetical protein
MQKRSNVREKIAEVLANPRIRRNPYSFVGEEDSVKFIIPIEPLGGLDFMKSVTLPLKKNFGNAMLDAEQMTTILTEIEAEINSRPLTYIGAEPNNLKALTPAQILRRFQASIRKLRSTLPTP